MAFTQGLQSAAETKSEAPKVKAAPRTSTEWALGAALLLFGGIAWVLGGMFTFDGWISWVNGLLGIVRLPIAIPAVVGAWRLLFVPLAIVYSWVETKNRPVWRDKAKQWHFEAPLFWVGFILITLTDIGSTAVGLQHTDAAAWGVLEPTVTWIIGESWRIGAVATLLTFAPEWLIIGAIWLLKR